MASPSVSYNAKGDMGGGGRGRGTQYFNIARKIGKYRNTVSKIVKMPIPHLDFFIIGHAYLKLHPSSLFIYLDRFIAYLLTFMACCVFGGLYVTCMREDTANERYRNTVKDPLLPDSDSQKDEKPHTAGLDDTAIPHVKI